MIQSDKHKNNIHTCGSNRCTHRIVVPHDFRIESLYPTISESNRCTPRFPDHTYMQLTWSACCKVDTSKKLIDGYYVVHISKKGREISVQYPTMFGQHGESESESDSMPDAWARMPKKRVRR